MGHEVVVVPRVMVKVRSMVSGFWTLQGPSAAIRIFS